MGCKAAERNVGVYAVPPARETLSRIIDKGKQDVNSIRIKPLSLKDAQLFVKEQLP